MFMRKCNARDLQLWFEHEVSPPHIPKGPCVEGLAPAGGTFFYFMLMPVILATQEAEIRRNEIQSHSRQTVQETLS
jgi:hypothetical protein